MSNILSAAIAIRGTRPLWWHAFGPDAIPLEKQERTGVAGNDPEEWKKTVLATKDGELYLPGSYAFGSLRDGSKYTKKGRGSIMTIFSATTQVTDDIILLGRRLPEGTPPTDPTEPVYLDVRSVRNPATKGRNVRYRIAAPAGWEAEFHVTWDKTIVSRNEMEAVANDAGRLVGIGDGRSIGMGRYAVVAFSIIPE